MGHVDFDVSVLRSLVAGMELRSFAKAADRVGRSTSAISAQLRKLEEQAGTPLFRKSGRGLALTEAGETMLAYARRMIELNDEAAVAVRGVDLEGWVRLGMQEDFGEAVLPEVLGRFARAHPKVRIEARVARNAELLERIETKQLDLALVWGDEALSVHNARGFSSKPIASPPMSWIGSSTVPWNLEAGEPLPLVAFDRPCLFHSAAIAALDRAGISWRVAFTSPSLSGLWAAAAAGLGLTVRTRYGLPATTQPFEALALGLPELPSIQLALLHTNVHTTPLVDRLAAIVLESFRSAPAPWERVAA
ncbi:LysR substrate-binding domain-containing protein [Paraburkholderia acidipaludis]|uniref:LysR substrate-binding domain-containing protein n=1 Tax=Paraburkholderia acidipaludis TaxID=660537 RepID=UPI000481329E|nr:LysR substrate-binding domain-containing protein [Paraburkholderia acidipaludis]